jgi:hypothetical protein
MPGVFSLPPDIYFGLYAGLFGAEERFKLQSGCLAIMA